MITVAIPVGPNRAYKKYLQECLDSLKHQTFTPDEVLLIDDMAYLHRWRLDFGDLPVRVHQNPWLCGCAHSFNFGVALAKNALVFMLGSDDKLHPWALDDCRKAFEKHKDPHGYYWCDVEYSDGETQAAACNFAMVTKKLWQRCGGFPIESSLGACDTMLLSILIANPDAGKLIHVESEQPPCWHRRHQGTVTVNSKHMWGPIGSVRDILTRDWKRPQWTGNNGR